MKCKKMEGCDGCLSVYFTRPLITGSGWVLSYDGFTEDLTDKMLVHVNKNYIVGFVFEHSFE